MRVVIFEPRPCCDDCRAMLEGSGYELAVCTEPDGLFGALLEGRPDAVVYVLGEPARDLSLLRLVRRAAPNLPIIVLGDPSNLTARRSVQPLKPTYYGVFPLEGAELRDALRGALRGSGRRSARASGRSSRSNDGSGDTHAP